MLSRRALIRKTRTTVTPDQVQAIQEQIRRRNARKNLKDFGYYVRPDFIGKAFHRYVAESIGKLVHGVIKRLIILAPPQHGKSLLSSMLLPPWAFGKDPRENIILASYNQEKANDFGRQARNLIQSEEYGTLFPDVSMAQDSTAANRFDMVQRAESGIWTPAGSYFAAGLGGPITGRPASLAIMDDLIKGPDEAYSEAHRAKVWNWYTDVIMTRLSGDLARVMLLQTTWHDDDLPSRLIKESAKGGEQWTVVRIPALALKNDPLGRKEGEALWPERKSRVFLLQAKARSPERFEALFQQNPFPEAGNIVKREWIHTWQKPPAHLDEVIISGDLAFKDSPGSSRVIFHIWGRVGADYYLLDRVGRLMEFTDTLSEFLELTRRWPEATAKLIEDKANGPALQSVLKNKVAGLIMVPVSKDKKSRFRAVAPLFRAGNVYIPDARVRPWAGEVQEEFVRFPNSEYNDDVDTCSQALAYWSVPEQGKDAPFEPWEL